MPYRWAILSLTPVLFLTCPTKGANPKVCTEKEENLAPDEADNLNWGAIYPSFKRFAH